MSAPVRLGIAGCGRIAERGYRPAAERLAEVELVAVADPDPDRAASFAAALGGASAFSTVEEMVAAGGLDAVVVATPVDGHVTAAASAAEAGLPCLVEKPPAPDLSGAIRLAALDPAPAIGFNRRFLQGVDLAPSVPAEGWLELELELRFRRTGWGAHECRDEALLDAGIHLIDLAAFLTGTAPIAVRDAVLGPERASFELELGRARARIVCATDRGYAERVEVVDRAGRTIASSRTGRLRAKLERLRDAEDPLVVSLRRQLARFAATISGGDAEELASPAAAVAAMGVVEAARRSAALGGAEITVGEPAPAGEARS